MTHSKFITIIFSVILFTDSCKEHREEKQQTAATVEAKNINKDSLEKKLKENISFIGDSLLKGKASLLQKYLSKYQPDTCGIIAYRDSSLKSDFEEAKRIGDINGDKIADTVFIIPPFNYCDDGDSYSFFDPALPRLFTDSYCCHPDNLFAIGDIDEDGIFEICIFYSTCAGRLKSLIAYTLKNGEWKQIGECTFDINIMTPVKEKRVRKISKGKFEMLDIEINDFTHRPLGDREWKRFSF